MKSEYSLYCKNHKIPIFAQPWWLNMVSSDKWDVVKAEYKGVTAFMPFCYHHKLLLKKIYQPLFTPYLGPVFQLPENITAYQRRQYENELIGNLSKQLPKHIEYKQKLFPTIDNHLPFYWQGFSQTTHYTYILDTHNSEAEIWQGIKNSLQRQIRKSAGICTILEDISDHNEIWQLAKKSLLRQKAPLIPEDKYALQIIHHAYMHNAAKSITAYHQDKPVASLFLVFDADYVYYLFGGYDNAYADTGAMTLLFWKAILFAKSLGLQFNFEGSMLKGVEQYFRSFGGTLMPVHFIWK